MKKFVCAIAVIVPAMAQADDCLPDQTAFNHAVNIHSERASVIRTTESRFLRETFPATVEEFPEKTGPEVVFRRSGNMNSLHVMVGHPCPTCASEIQVFFDPCSMSLDTLTIWKKPN